MRKCLNHQMEKHMDEMQEVLPLKLRARDEIRSYFQLTREFKTLSTVASKRNLKILARENKAINVNLKHLTTEINEMNNVLVELKVKKTEQELNSSKQKKLYELTREQQNELRDKKNEFHINMPSTIEPREVLLDIHDRFISQHSKSLQIFNELENRIVNNAEHSNDKYFKLQTQIEAIRWKLALKGVHNEEELEMKLQQFKLTLNSTRSSSLYLKESLKDVNAELEHFKVKASAVGSIDTKLNEAAKVHYGYQIECQKTILELSIEIFNHRREILDSDELIASAAAKGQADMTTIETLAAIEECVMKSPELAAHYLGPVFQHLKADTGIDIKMWNQLKTFANIILFERGSTARELNRRLVASGLKLGSYILLGCNEFIPSAFNVPDHEVAEKIKSAELLVPDNNPYKQRLKPLLRHLIMMNENDVSFEELSSFPEMIVYSSDSVTTVSNKFVAIQSSLPNYAEMKDMSPIEVLQNIYESVKQRGKEKKKLENSLSTKNQIEEELLNGDRKYKEIFNSLNNLQAESVIAFQQILTTLEEKIGLEHLYRLKTAQTQELTKMNENIRNNLNNWDVVVLKNMMEEMQLQLITDEKLSTRLKENVEMSKKMLENSIEIMEILSSNMECSWNSLTESTLETEFIELCHKNLAWYNEKLEKSKKNLQEALQPVIINSQLNLDLFKIRCRFYEENSDLDVVLNAIKHCKEDINISDNVANFNQSVYDEYRHESDEKLKDVIDECLRKLQTHNMSSKIGEVTKERYGHLKESIRKVEDYIASPEQAPILRNKIAARIYPVINKVIVKELKDAVHNYSLAFSSTMVDFVKDSKLFFYTHGLFDEVNEDDFNWNCFNLGRLKAMDFVVNWKTKGKEKIGSATLRMVKGLLLITYIISYISIFKFIIIDEMIYKVSDKVKYFKMNFKQRFLKGHRRDS